jgi:hypothetical protein
MTCELPSQPNCVSIFLDNRTESEAFVSTDGDDKHKVFIGRLNLQKLGFKDQILRFLGNLSTLYIARNNSVSSSIDEYVGDK